MKYLNKEKVIAVIGAGYWGKNLVRNFYELGVLKTICDNNEKTLKVLQEQYKEINTTFEYQTVLNDPDIKGIVITLPVKDHFNFARQALEAGKHIYVEKPLTVKISEAEQLVLIAKEKNRILMVGHLFQYHSHFQHLKNMIRNGELGKIFYIYSNQLNLGKIRAEENILWSFAPHDISMILSITGEEPVNVSAKSGEYLQSNIADFTVVHMEFPGGIKAHIFVSWLNPYKERKLVVIGEKKSAVFEDTTEEWNSKLVLYPYSINWINDIPSVEKYSPERVLIEKSEPLKNACEHFLRCIETSENPVTDGEEGLRVLRVINLAQECLDNERFN